MLEGLGILEENSQVFMPIFENHLDVSKIAKNICYRFKQSPPDIPALLSRNHEVTV